MKALIPTGSLRSGLELSASSHKVQAWTPALQSVDCYFRIDDITLKRWVPMMAIRNEGEPMPT